MKLKDSLTTIRDYLFDQRNRSELATIPPTFKQVRGGA